MAETLARGFRLTTLALVLLVAAARGAPAAAAAAQPDVVQSVRATVESTVPLPEPLRARIEASLTRVAERIMLGQAISQVRDSKPELERVLREVFGRILIGFCLEEVHVTAGPEAGVVLVLAPDGPCIRQLDFALETPGLSDGGQALLRQILDEHRGSCARLFAGVPLKAMEWAQSVLLPILEESLRDEFPGFWPHLAARPAETLVLSVVLEPRQPAVAEVEADLTSVTLPRLLVGMWRSRAQEHLSILVGMPVAFLRSQQGRFTRLAAQWMAEDPALARFGLRWRVSLYPGTTTRAVLTVEAEHLSLTAQGEVEFTDPVVLGLRLRAGVRPLDRWELAGEIVIDSRGSGVDYRVSVSNTLSPEMTIGFTHGIREAEHLLWLRYESGYGEMFVLSSDLETRAFSATIGLSVESGLSVTLTVDSDRKLCLAAQLEL